MVGPEKQENYFCEFVVDGPEIYNEELKGLTVVCCRISSEKIVNNFVGSIFLNF